MRLTIGRRLSATFSAPTAELEFAEASRIYCEARDESGEGGSTFPEGRLVSSDGARFRVSYNGRIWPDRKWQPGDQPVWG